MFISYSKPTSPVRVTVVGTHENGVLTIAVARCSKSDSVKFNKAKGREIANKRLKEDKYYEKIDIKECSGKDFINFAQGVIKQVESDPKVYHTNVMKTINKTKNIRMIQKYDALIRKYRRLRAMIVTDLPDNTKKSVENAEESMHARFANPDE